jgi:protein phosphatase
VKITIPELSLVLLVGPSGCGKSSFARKHFLPTEVVSSDFCRALVSDNENDQSATGDAFDLLHEIIRKRLARGRLTVVDATNVQPEARKPLIALAKEFHLFAEAIVFDLPERLCQDRNVLRPDRQFGSHVVRNQSQQLRRSLRGLEREGVRHVFKLSSPEEVDSVTIERQPLWNNKKLSVGRSILSATFMAASMSWSNCWENSTTRSIAKVMDILSQPPMVASLCSSVISLIVVLVRCKCSVSSQT